VAKPSRRFREADVERFSFSVAHHFERNGLTRLEVADDALQRVHVIGALTVGAHDDVPHFDPRALSGAIHIGGEARHKNPRDLIELRAPCCRRVHLID